MRMVYSTRFLNIFIWVTSPINACSKAFCIHNWVTHHRTGQLIDQSKNPQYGQLVEGQVVWFKNWSNTLTGSKTN